MNVLSISFVRACVHVYNVIIESFGIVEIWTFTFTLDNSTQKKFFELCVAQFLICLWLIDSHTRTHMYSVRSRLKVLIRFIFRAYFSIENQIPLKFRIWKFQYFPGRIYAIWCGLFEFDGVLSTNCDQICKKNHHRKIEKMSHMCLKCNTFCARMNVHLCSICSKIYFEFCIACDVNTEF